MQIRSGKGLPERGGDRLIGVLKGQAVVLHLGQGREIVRREDLALHDGEIDQCGIS